MPAKASDYRSVLTEALNEFAQHGYDSQDRLDYWLGRLREAIEREVPDTASMRARVRQRLASIFDRFRRGGYEKQHPGLREAAIGRVGRDLASLLEQRIMASADLIKVNRKKAVDQTLQRFIGMASSVPPGGTKAMDKREAKANISKALRQLPFEERRVIIDQGHKLVANINQTVAEGNGAIAIIWRSNYRVPGYDYREDHKERSGKVYMIRGNWAQKASLVKVGPDGYYDQITAVAEEPFCQCWAEYIYDLTELPADMLTQKGQAAIS